MTIQVEASWQSDGGDMSIEMPTGTDFLLVFYTLGRASSEIASLDYNGDALTELDSAINSGDAVVQCWYLANPDTGGSYTLNSPRDDGTLPRDAVIAIALSGVDTSDPFRDYETETGDALNISNSEITSAVGDLVLDAVAEWRDRKPDEGAGQTELQSGSNYGSSYKAGASSVTMEWDLNYNTSHYAWFIVSLQPPSAAPSDWLPEPVLIFI